MLLRPAASVLKNAVARCRPSLQSERAASSLTDSFKSLTEDIPQKDAIRFKEHAKLWTRKELKKQVEALAVGFRDFGCKPGTTVAIWLPEYAEKVTCQLAAALAGFQLVIVDPTLTKVEDFDKVLTDTQPKIVIVHEKCNENLKAAIPEMEFFALKHDFTGRHFRSRKFTNLRYCSHTGYDLESGFIQFSQLLTYDTDVNPLPKMIAAVSDETPLSITYTSENGKPVASKANTHKDVLTDPAWSVVKRLLSKEYVVLDKRAL